VPLGNLGHGASRLFEIAILLAHARGGVFLIDEIEVGLHHLAMESVWHMILETSQQLDIQVFATTHSKDCIQALASLYRRNRALQDVVALHRLEAGATRSERFSIDDVEVADDAKVELRGLQ
jgi:AAA15 family ATPase/GTPase